MVFIKKLVMQGFKSFARKTEVVFDRGINVILGPNGAGKTNISDGLCFVLGRLSVKSMRASKARNLLFMGSKYIKPAREAYVELIFDNSDRAFSIDRDEVILKRIVRHNGQSVYKINNETKTRAEIIELLAYAGIDPYGFNIVLQGQIQSIVKMHSEDRRKIIEEVAGIAIYESRKEKALHELEKSDERLKEISAILRERTAYLRNLERERAQAMKFKELEMTVKRCKASIITKKRDEKNKEINSIVKSIDSKDHEKKKIREKIDALRTKMEETTEKVNEINKNIQKATGLEQDTLHGQIANLKAELEGLRVRKENYENRKSEIEKRIFEMEKSVPELQTDITNLRQKSPLMAQKAHELKKKKDELGEIEQERKRLLTVKTELNSVRERIKDKERQLSRVNGESEAILKILEEISSNLKHKSEAECAKALHSLKESIESKRKELDKIHKDEVENEKAISVAESEARRYEKIKEDVGKLDVCPLCQSKMTEFHISHVFKESDKKIGEATSRIEHIERLLKSLKERKENLHDETSSTEKKISELSNELIKHKGAKEKHEQLKKAVNEEKTIRNEINELENKLKNLETKTSDISKTEEKYDSKILEIEEISSRTEEDVDTSLLYKERELENVKNIVKRSREDVIDVEGSIEDISNSLEEKSDLLERKENQEKELNEKFNMMFKKRDEMQKTIQELSLEISEKQNESRAVEDQINYLNVGKARLDAEKESLDIELGDFVGIELFQGSVENLDERMRKAQESLQQIGSVNMRALEAYEEMKKEYDIVYDKVQILEKEKIEILKIIEEIDKKKTRTFMKTFNAMNDLFTRNFAQLYTKGTAYLEIDNKENIFEGGVNIVVKVGKGKYFDVTSLSGGEQTLVALALLFAIQEYKPYHFYIFDEIDAALDRRNSERLSALLNKYMQAGQYIVITHNDAIILNSNILYGVSMHEGASKILSLKVS